jgi:outer membrane lipoprotein-sorting protein
MEVRKIGGVPGSNVQNRRLGTGCSGPSILKPYNMTPLPLRAGPLRAGPLRAGSALKQKETPMHSIRNASLAITVLMLGMPVVGEEPAADEVLKQVSEKYKTMETYKAEGTIQMDADAAGRKIQLETSFTMLLKKPNLYLISWEQTGIVPQSGAAWNDGNQPYLYMGATNAYAKMESDEIALGGATGISGGAAFTIPSLFLPVFTQPAELSRLNDPQIERSEAVEGDDCYVIAGPSAFSAKETFWVSKESHLIRKYRRSLEGASIPDFTDEQIEEGVKGLGQEVTEESKKKMRQMMERSRKLMSTMKMKGSSTELHKSVSSPELKASDFQFSPPQSAALKESLFGGFLGGK